MVEVAVVVIMRITIQRTEDYGDAEEALAERNHSSFNKFIAVMRFEPLTLWRSL